MGSAVIIGKLVQLDTVNAASRDELGCRGT